MKFMLLTLGIVLQLLSFSQDTIIDRGIYQSYYSYSLQQPMYVKYVLWKGGGECSRSKFRFINDTETFKTSGEFYQDWIDNAPFKVSLDKGLWEAVEEFLDRNKYKWELHEHYTNQNGLTILKRKNETYEL